MSKHKFKIGDRVRFINKRKNEVCIIPDGSIGTIVHITYYDKYNTFPIDVRFDKQIMYDGANYGYTISCDKASLFKYYVENT